MRDALTSAAGNPVDTCLVFDVAAGRNGFLGGGAFGAVFGMRLRDDPTCPPLAAKYIVNVAQSSEGFLARQRHETALFERGGALFGVDHPNVMAVVHSGSHSPPVRAAWEAVKPTFGVLEPAIIAAPVGEQSGARLRELVAPFPQGPRQRPMLFRRVKPDEARRYAELHGQSQALPLCVQEALAEAPAAAGAAAPNFRMLQVTRPSMCIVMPRYACELGSVVLGLHEQATDSWIAWPIVRQWAMELGSAIGWLHEHGVLHLDLKLDNVMMDGTPEEVEAGTGRLVVVDLGVHRHMPAVVCDPGNRRQGMAVLDTEAWYPVDRQSRWVMPMGPDGSIAKGGNGAHWAPELHAASRMQSDPATAGGDVAVDFTKQPVFALGVLLHEMCMGGEHPIEGYPFRLAGPSTPSFGTEVERLADHDCPYPACFQELVERMLQCNPRDRPTMAELVERLSQLT